MAIMSYFRQDDRWEWDGAVQREKYVTGELVAVKALSSDVVARDPEIVERFVREGQALRQLNHPNIETVHDFDTHEGVDFLVTEYVSGSTLRDRLAQGPLPEAEVIALGMQLAAALEERPAVERTVTPSSLPMTYASVVLPSPGGP